MPAMCGIAGAVALNGNDLAPGFGGHMRDALQHRGPDGNGEHDGPGVSIAACRLAIVDLEPRGIMPMASADGRFHIVHNGEIYNRPELRDDLIRRGVELRTTTDTEVILQLYALDGPAMLDRLDGMFAFAIWDAQQRELFAARDRVGEKPFYYATHNGRFLFASEPKALFAAGVPCEFADETWLELMTFRSAAGERSVYRGVKRLSARALAARRRRQRPDRAVVAIPEQRPRTGQGVVRQAVRSVQSGRRLIADVPVGTLLSGGLDSSAVTAVGASLSERRLPSFTVRYDGTPLDEGEFASATARMTGIEHHEVRVPGDEIPGLLVDATYFLDEPINFPASPGDPRRKPLRPEPRSRAADRRDGR